MPLLIPILPVVLVAGLVAILYIVTSRRKRNDSSPKSRKFRGRDRDAIVREARRRLTQNPRDPEALGALGELQYNEGNFAEASKTYRTLIELSATMPTVDEYNATVRYALSALKCNEIDEAYKSLLIARSLKEDEFEVNYNLGYLEYLHKNYERAILLLSRARVSQPDDPQTLRFLGHSLFKAKRFAEAAALLRKAVEQSPGDKESLFAVARSYHEMGQNEQAIKIFSHLRADPQFGPSAALFAGTIHLQTRQYGDALMDFQLGLRHANIPAEVLLELKYRLAATHIKLEEIGEAIRLLQEIQSASPGYKDVDEQIRRYRELNSNQNLKVFLISPTSEFVTLCRRIAVGFFPDAKVKITDVSIQRSEYADILADVVTPKWEDVILFRFVRTTGVVGELILRDLYSRIKEVKAGRGFCLAAGDYSEGAKQFVEARLIDLVNKEQLTAHLSSLDARNVIETPAQVEARRDRLSQRSRSDIEESSASIEPVAESESDDDAAPAPGAETEEARRGEPSEATQDGAPASRRASAGARRPIR